MPPQTASGGMSPERFKQGSQNFICLLYTIAPTNLPDMTSLAVSSRLQKCSTCSTLVLCLPAVKFVWCITDLTPSVCCLFLLGKTPFCPYVGVGWPRRHSCLTKWGSHISRERFDLESPNFARTSISTCSASALDMMPLAGSEGDWWLTIESSFVLLGGVGHSGVLFLNWSSSWLQNAIKCCTKVRKTSGLAKSHIIRPLFNPESPNFARTSRPTLSAAMLDMASPTSSGQHLSKFEQRSKMLPSTASGRIAGGRFKQG